MKKWAVVYFNAVTIITCKLSLSSSEECVVCGKTEEEKLQIYQSRLAGVKLPSFVFFKRTEQLSCPPESLVESTVQIEDKEQPFLPDYNTHLAQALSTLLNWTIHGGPSMKMFDINLNDVSTTTVVRRSARSLSEKSAHDEMQSLQKRYVGNIRKRLDGIKKDLRMLEVLGKRFPKRNPSQPHMDFKSYVLRRSRRETSTIIECHDKGSLTPNSKLRFCKFCIQQTVLPSNRIPQYINEVVCDQSDTGCMSNEGCCFQKIIHATFLQDLGGGNVEEYSQAIRTGCECELSQGSVFESFLTG